MSKEEMKEKSFADEKDIEVKDGNEQAANEDKEEQTPNTEASTKQELSADDKLAAAEAQIAELKDKYLRSVAEFDNYKKRTLKEKAELLLNGSEKTVCAILPILDDFERALADNTDDAAAMKKGMQLIFNKFCKTLEALGVKQIETEGKDFDVDFHEAVAMVPGMGFAEKNSSDYDSYY